MSENICGGSTEAVILAGGKGTRVRHILGATPKCLAPVAGRPFLYYPLAAISEAGMRSVLLCVEQAGIYKKALGAFEAGLGVQCRYAAEDFPLGTGGAIRRALDFTGASNLLVMNGDSYSDFDLSDFIRGYQAARVPSAAVLVPAPEPASRFGTVRFDADGLVTAFAEKSPAGSQAPWINAGIYLFSREIISPWPSGKNISLEYEILPELVRQKKLGAFPVRASFIDIGTPEALAGAEHFFGAGARV